MVYRFDNTMTQEDLVSLLERIRNDRAKERTQNYMQFFGTLPDIGDGLKYQKNVRNEWD